MNQEIAQMKAELNALAMPKGYVYGQPLPVETDIERTERKQRYNVLTKALRDAVEAHIVPIEAALRAQNISFLSDYRVGEVSIRLSDARTGNTVIQPVASVSDIAPALKKARAELKDAQASTRKNRSIQRQLEQE